MKPIWVKYLPPFIQCRLEGRHNLQNILTNTGWLFGDQILRMGVGLVVGVWVARYLGPEQFGMLNYAIAFVALFGAIASLGLNGIVVRDIVKEPETANSTLGTAFLLQIIGGLLAFTLAVISISFIRPDEGLTKLMVAIFAFVMVFKASDIVKYWFESELQSKYVVWIENSVFLLLSTAKIGLILVHASLITFVWAAFIEGLLVTTGLLWIYNRSGGHLSAWKIHFVRAKILLRDSWPLILSGLTIMIYMRIDQIMLGQMLGNEAVGIYSAAVRISEVWYMIPMVIVTSLFPSIIEAKKKDERIYQERMQNLLSFMAFASIIIALSISLFSDWIITTLYGNLYTGAGDVLMIHIWACLFVFLGVAGGKWYLIENLQYLNFYRTAIGAIVNISLNFYLIPLYGAYGAAIATVISYGIAAYILDGFSSKTRVLFIAKSRAIFLLPYLLLRWINK